MPIEGEYKVRLEKAERVEKEGGRRLTEKEGRFVREYTNPGGEGFLKAGEAYRVGYEVGDEVKPASVRSMGCRALQRPAVKEAIESALVHVGITPDYQARKLKQLMESTKKMYHNGIEIDEIPDNEVQLKALNASFKVTEVITKIQDDVSGGIQVNISESTAQRLLGIAEEMRRIRQVMHGE